MCTLSHQVIPGAIATLIIFASAECMQHGANGAIVEMTSVEGASRLAQSSCLVRGCPAFHTVDGWQGSLRRTVGEQTCLRSFAIIPVCLCLCLTRRCRPHRCCARRRDGLARAATGRRRVYPTGVPLRAMRLARGSGSRRGGHPLLTQSGTSDPRETAAPNRHLRSHAHTQAQRHALRTAHQQAACFGAEVQLVQSSRRVTQATAQPTCGATSSSSSAVSPRLVRIAPQTIVPPLMRMHHQ